MKKDLSERFIANLKPPTGDRKLQVSDLSCDNLVLRVYATGRKVFMWQGRMNGKMRTITLGAYPTHGLAAARKWAAKITEGRDLGIDVIEVEEATAKAEQEADSRNVDWLFDLYMVNEGGLRKSGDEKRRMYDRDIKPIVGSKRAEDVTYDDLAGIIAKKHETAPVMSNALQSLIARLFRWATTKGRPLTGMSMNPASSLVKLAPPPQRERVLDDTELRLFFAACAETNSIFTETLIFILHTGARREEGFSLPWKEINLTNGQWLLDKKRSKNGRELLLPLPTQMILLLKERHKLSGFGTYVWPGKLEGKAQGGFSKPMKALHAKMEEIASKQAGEPVTIERWTIHDLRRSLSTGMNSLCDDEGMPLIPGDIIERVINHVIGGVRGTYNRAEYLREKKRALQIWADHLATLRG